MAQKDQSMSAKFPTVLLLLLISSAMLFSNKKERVADFRLYIHDVVGGATPTAIEVARANTTSDSPTYFGQTLVACDLMTEGPDINSRKLGRAQGIAASTGLDDLAFVVNGVMLFTDGEFKGSSLNILGWKLMVEDNQEIPVVGGTGVFRMARGYTVTNLHSFDPVIKDYLFTFDFHVVYPAEASGIWGLF